MKHKFRLATGLLLLCLVRPANAQERQSDFEPAQQAVVKVRVSWQTTGKGVGDEGTGFIIDSTATQLMILTNRHVIAYPDSNVGWRQAPHLWVIPYSTPDTIRVARTNVCFDPREGDDLAVLYIDRKKVSNFHVLPISKRLQFDGAELRTISYPVQSDRDRQPLITRWRLESHKKQFYHIAFADTTSVVGGESGSPVLNERRAAVGVVTRKLVTGASSTNYILRSLAVRDFLKEQCQFIPPSGENQILALPEIDFMPADKRQKWSKPFIAHLKKNISHCPELRTRSGKELQEQFYWLGQPHLGSMRRIDQLYDLPSYILRGTGRKEGKFFSLDMSLRLVPGEELVMSKQVQARDLQSLADSAVVHIARYFDYQTEFAGAPYGRRKWSLRAAVGGTLLTFFLVRAADQSQNAYDLALNSLETENNYSRMHREELLRNAVAIATGASLIVWNHAAFIKPRKPEFEKEVK